MDPCVPMETRRSRGRPRKYPIQPKVSELRRKERIKKFGSFFSQQGGGPQFIDKMRPPPQTICVTLALPSLVLIDLYLEFASERSLLGHRIHHGTVIDSLVDRLREDSAFSSWLLVHGTHGKDSPQLLSRSKDG